MTPQPRAISLVPQLVAGLGAAVLLFVLFTLPPRAARLAQMAPDPRVVWGGYHLHSNRSDGSGSVDDIAAAASRAGLQFIVLTDHGDAMRAPDPPQYRHGVLCIDAAEITTAGGHVVAMGLKSATPYRLAGEASDVIEDIHRWGGWAIAAHPDSPKPELRWRAPNTTAFDAIEWLNIDSEWRDEKPARLAATFARYFVRGPETIASLFGRPTQTLRRWDAAARVRPVVSLAALDAHARLPWRNREGGDRTIAAVPSYLQMFRTMAQAAMLERPLSGNAAVDADLVTDALRAGHSYSAVTAVAAPAQLSFFATAGDSTVGMGDWIGPVGTAAAWHAGTNDKTARVALIHNGQEIASGRGTLDFTGTVSNGPYRIEAYRPGIGVPWLISNPIFGGEPPARTPAVPDDGAAIAPAARLVPLTAPDKWNIEKNATSTGVATAEGKSTKFSFALGPGVPYDQFAALSAPVDGAFSAEGFDRVQFTIRADRPMRLSVQVRLPASRGHERWRHSVYADTTPRSVVALLQDFQPADLPTSQRPIVAHIRGVLFVIDTLNNVPGTRGSIWVSDVQLGAPK